MERHHAAGIYSGISLEMLLLVLLVLFVNGSRANAEMYVGGQVGTTFFGDNNKLTNIELTDFSPHATSSGRDLATSPVMGGKVGYYFPKIGWFGLEMEASYTTPHIEQQPTRVTIAPGSTVNGVPFPISGSFVSVTPGDYFRVITIAPFNLMFRYHKSRFQPYIGIGPGIFLTRVKTTLAGFEGTDSSTSVGLNAKLGAEYFFTRNLSGYGEVRYNYTKLDFDANGFTAVYNPIIFSVGVGYHF